MIWPSLGWDGWRGFGTTQYGAYGIKAGVGGGVGGLRH